MTASKLAPPQEPDWEALPDRAKAILAKVAVPFEHGYSAEEIAQSLGVPRSRVLRWLAELREEIVRVS